MLARITQLEAVEDSSQHFLDLPKQVKFTFETFALTEHFDPEQPEWLLRRTDEGTINTEDLLAEDIVGNVPDWSVLEWCGNAKDIGLPAECFAKLAEEIECLHEGDIEEWLGLGNAVPEGLSEAVAEIYARYAEEWSNDNVELEPASGLAPSPVTAPTSVEMLAPVSETHELKQKFSYEIRPIPYDPWDITPVIDTAPNWEEAEALLKTYEFMRGEKLMITQRLLQEAVDG